MNQLHSGNDAPGSVLRGDAITLDLRHPPARADLGFAAGRNDRAYQRTSADLAVSVLLPGGTLRAPAFVVSADGNDFTPAGQARPRQPEHIVVERVFDSAAHAADSLTADAALLGLDRADLELLLTRVDRGRPPALPQRGSLQGLVRGWLSVSVDVIGHEDPSVQVNYVFTVHQFHSAETDKVVTDGVFALDLRTHRPSRADLGFRDTYSLATLRPEPGTTLTARLALPDGVLSREVAEVVSSTTSPGVDDPDGTGNPVRTSLQLRALSSTDAERVLRADAAVLGLDARAVDAIFAGAPGTPVSRTLPGAVTPACEVSAVVSVQLGQPGGFAAAVRYDVSYR